MPRTDRAARSVNAGRIWSSQGLLRRAVAVVSALGLITGCGSQEADEATNTAAIAAVEQARELLRSFCGGGISDVDGPISGIRAAGSSSDYEQSLALEPGSFYEVCLVAPSSELHSTWTVDGAHAMLSLPLRVTEAPTALETRIEDTSGAVSNQLLVRTATGAPDLRLWSGQGLTMDGGRRTVLPGETSTMDGSEDFRSLAIGCTPDGIEQEEQQPCVTAALFRVSAQPVAAYTVSLRGSIDDPSAELGPTGRHPLVVVNRNDLAEDGSASIVVDLEARNNSEIRISRPGFDLTLIGPGMSVRPGDWAQRLGPSRIPTGVPASGAITVGSGHLAPDRAVELAAGIHLDPSAIAALCRDEAVAIEIRGVADGRAESSDRVPILAGPDLCPTS